MNPRVGMVLIGYCNGVFGRDSYDDKRVEGFGEDWLVVRENGLPDFVSFKDRAHMESSLAEWTSEKYVSEWKDR